MKMYLPSNVIGAYVNLNKTEHIDIYKYIAKPPGIKILGVDFYV